MTRLEHHIRYGDGFDGIDESKEAILQRQAEMTELQTLEAAVVEATPIYAL